MKRIFIIKLSIVLTLISSSPSLASPVDIETAKEKAASFLAFHTSRSATREDLTLRLSSHNSYLFENEESFALVAADNTLPEILGYGNKGEGYLPQSLIAYIEAPKFARREKSLSETRPVGPLLPFVRHQKHPYNNHCPYYEDREGNVSSERCVVGCVATALEEIISSYRRTVVIKDTLKGWETPHYTIADVMPGTTVNCSLIRDNYDVENYTCEEADAVSRLSYYCGVAAKMNWGLTESGANISNLVNPLKNAFDYKYVHFVDSYQYDPTDWNKMIRNEIYAHRPVLYAAFNMWMNGHAFVIDGLDDKGFFHVNWAYAGSYDGYFRLDVLNYNEPPEQLTPEGMEAGFYSNHQALLLYPDSVKVNLPDTLTRTGYEITVDSVSIDLHPETGKHTPITVYLRNTTNQALTTPFELFTNLPQDTALLEQGDFVALGAAILAPKEQRAMKIHAAFTEPGERILRISPDDKAILYEGKVNVAEGKKPQLTFREPQICFPAPNQALVTLAVSNDAKAGRCGQEVLYEMGPGDANTMKDGVRHSRHLYVLPGETKCDTTRFDFLEEGKAYTLLIRSPWKIRTQTTIVVPKNTGISNTNQSGHPDNTVWYTIDGKKLSALPQRKGLYLERRNNKTHKIFLSR